MASLEAKLMGEQHKLHQEMLSVLTAEQKAQLEQSKAQFKSRRGKMRGHRQSVSVSPTELADIQLFERVRHPLNR